MYNSFDFLVVIFFPNLCSKVNKYSTLQDSNYMFYMGYLFTAAGYPLCESVRNIFLFFNIKINLTFENHKNTFLVITYYSIWTVKN